MNEDKIILQSLREKDLPAVIETFSFPWTSLQATKMKWEHYYTEQQKGIRTVCLARIQDEYIGYGSLLRMSEYPSFRNNGIAEINDIWTSPKYRGSEIGKKLIRHLEEIALQKSYKQVGIGVGLYRDYGPAQKLYIQMGYLPDENGVTYRCRPVVPGDAYPLNDDLLIWFKKDLKESFVREEKSGFYAPFQIEVAALHA